MIRDLTWSDPAEAVTKGFSKPLARSWNLAALDAKAAAVEASLKRDMFEPNPSRGNLICAYTLRALQVFLKQNNLLCIIRGHEQTDGFEFGRSGIAIVYLIVK